MKKVVLKLDFCDEKIKQKAMKNVSSLSGVDSISMDMKDKKLTVTGDVDPVTVVSKLRKLCHTEIVSVGPAKEPEKKKDEPKSGDNKKEDDKKKGDNNKNKKPDTKDEALKIAYSVPAYHHHQQQTYPYYNYQQQQPYYSYNNPPAPYYTKVVHDESPNCVIC